MKFYLAILVILSVSFSIYSCSSDSGTNTTPAENKGSVVLTGDTSATIVSLAGQIINSSPSNEFTTLQFYNTEGTNITSVVIRFKDYDSDDKIFDLSRDNNFASVSFLNGAISYQAYSGTLNITERATKRIKATFNFKAKKIGDSSKEIDVQNGLFDFAL